MKSERILFTVILSDKHQPTGKTRHYIGWPGNRELLPTPHSLAITQFEGNSGFYLYYLDSNGKEQTDTYHDTLDKAKHQADLEFNVKDSDWETYEDSP